MYNKHATTGCPQSTEQSERSLFIAFCNDYNLEYNFEYLGYSFADNHTQQAFICWKYGRGKN